MDKVTVSMLSGLAAFSFHVPAFAAHVDVESEAHCAMEHLSGMREKVVELKEIADAMEEVRS